MKIDIRKIKHHPLNREIYSLSSIDELAESINDVGLLQPLTIDQNNQIISGNRRFESIKRLGWKKVDINRITVKNGDEVLILVHFNKQRVKSIQEQLNEYDHLQKYYKKNKKSKGGVKSIRKKIGDDIKISDGQLARILFVRKHSPELIDLIDKQILTINQAYLQSSRSLKEKKSINNNDKIILENAMVGDWVFFQKSSDKMVELSDEEVDVIFTSPPFYAKRLYQKEGGIGNELTSDDYVRNLVTHLDDCYRVLNHSGSFFLNLGDTFKNGNLQNIPHKVSIQLQDKGWILRNTIIWSKKNPKPSASKTNLCPSYEFIFHMTKSTNYNYTPTLSSILSKTRPSLPPRHRSDKVISYSSVSPYLPNSEGKNMGDYWDEDIVKTAVVNQKKVNGIEHPAMFPDQIVYLPLLQTVVYPFLGQDLDRQLMVLDPFAGSLTVGKVVKRINEQYGIRIKFVGYDIKKYF